MIAIPAKLTPRPAITPPRITPLDTLDDENIGLGFVEEVGEGWAGAPNDEFRAGAPGDEGLTIFLDLARGRTRENMSARSESFQPPFGDLNVLWPEELSDR